MRIAEVIGNVTLSRCHPSIAGFRWIVGNDADQSVYAYERSAPGEKPCISIVNMTPVPREHYRIGVPLAGAWRERHWVVEMICFNFRHPVSTKIDPHQCAEKWPASHGHQMVSIRRHE